MNPEEAASALREVERTEQRTAAVGYNLGASAPLIVWGLVWLACNVLSQLAPVWGPRSWAAGIVIGLFGNLLLARRGSGKRDKRALASLGLYLGFFLTLSMVLKLSGKAEQNLVASLLVAAAYILIGVWRSARIGYAGLALAALTLLGWYVVPHWFFLWMGVVGGGALVLAGLWLRET